MEFNAGPLEDLVMDANFWKNKTVFLTGHTGFKGSWLSLWLQQLNAKVIGYALPPNTTPNLFTHANVGTNMISIEADIRDYETLKKCVHQHQPDIIFHLAAQPLVRYSYKEPIETYATNVMGTVNVLEAARHLECCRALINITTDKCYENKEWDWGYREIDTLGGYDPYSNSKACSELVTLAFQNSYYHSSHCGLATARAGNVIGGGDWAEERLIPDIIRGIFREEQIEIRYPNALRPWQHVLEPLSGYLTLAEAVFEQPMSYSGAWNFGPYEQDIKSVQWVVERLLQLCHSKLPWHKTIQNQLHEATYLKLDSAKSRNQLGWQPQWNLEEALAQTADWYLSYRQGDNMYQKTLKQINYFTSELR
jgi:CDP-glucose 4,6-dehydratase